MTRGGRVCRRSSGHRNLGPLPQCVAPPGHRRDGIASTHGVRLAGRLRIVRPVNTAPGSWIRGRAADSRPDPPQRTIPWAPPRHPTRRTLLHLEQHRSNPPLGKCGAPRRVCPGARQVVPGSVAPMQWGRAAGRSRPDEACPSRQCCGGGRSRRCGGSLRLLVGSRQILAPSNLPALTHSLTQRVTFRGCRSGFLRTFASTPPRRATVPAMQWRWALPWPLLVHAICSVPPSGPPPSS